MADLPKAARKRARELVGLAYERELSTALTKLEKTFARWHAGEATAFDVNDAIHDFHDGESRELWKYYANAPSSALEFTVAGAIHRGLVSEEEAGPAVLAGLERHLKFLREDK